MDKKSILALVVIAVIILLIPYYQKLIMGDQPIPDPADITTSDSNHKPINEKDASQFEKQPSLKNIKKTSISETQKSSSKRLTIQDGVEHLYKISSDKISLVLSNRGGGALKQFILNKYALNDSQMVNMVDPQIANDVFLAFQSNSGEYINTSDYFFNSEKTAGSIHLDENDFYKISFTLDINGDVLTKTYIFYGNSYHFDVVVHFSNPDRMLLNRQYQFGWQNGLPSTESYKSDDNTYKQAFVYMADELESYDVTDVGKSDPVTLTGKADWIATRTKYFLGAICNINANVSDGVYFSGEGIQQQDFVQRIYDIGFNTRYVDNKEDSLRVYLGPLDTKEIKQYGKNLDILVMNNGWYERIFRFFSLFVLKVLELLHKVIPNYGVVIIVFSILIKLLVYPLTRKSYTSMKKMQNIGPLVAGLKEKYKGDPQRLNKETMKLYKEHGVNPLGGCLPTLIQMPLLIALFIVFRSTIELRGAMFIPGWIPDLSRPDTLFLLPFSLPMYGNEFNILPILMAVTMMFQSKMTMQDPKQKAMVYLMPVFMLLIFNRFPSGLNLYYTLFNLLTIIQQKFISTGADPEPLPVEKTKKKKKK